MVKNELLQGLTEEQIAKVKACKDQEEALALAKAEGIELSDEQLEAVSGGACTTTYVACPHCGKQNFSCIISCGEEKTYCRCLVCKTEWTVDHMISNRAWKVHD